MSKLSVNSFFSGNISALKLLALFAFITVSFRLLFEGVITITYDFQSHVQSVDMEYPTQFTRDNQEYAKFKSRLIVVPHHKLLYCNIAKNANSMFRTLSYAMMKNDPNMSFIEDGHFSVATQMNGMAQLQKASGFWFRINDHEKVYKTILKDASWRKLVIIRDPLERLLSGYLDKCFGSRRQIERYCVEGKTDSFTEFAERILNATLDGEGRVLNHHFFPQHLYCDLYKRYPHYNHVIVYHHDTIGNDTLRFLQSINLTQYYYHWGLSHNEPMFTVSAHPTFNSSQNINDFYKQYYKTKQFARRVIKMY
eukprot:483857_1